MSVRFSAVDRKREAEADAIVSWDESGGACVGCHPVPIGATLHTAAAPRRILCIARAARRGTVRLAGRSHKQIDCLVDTRNCYRFAGHERAATRVKNRQYNAILLCVQR